MIGSLGEVSFVASADLLRTFQGLTKKYAGRYAKHDIIGKKPMLEFIGPDTRKFSMSIRLDITKGVKPKDEIDRLASMTETGKAEPLMIGNQYFGLYVLNGLSETSKFHDNKGNLWLADVSLELEEYADE